MDNVDIRGGYYRCYGRYLYECQSYADHFKFLYWSYECCRHPGAGIDHKRLEQCIHQLWPDCNCSYHGGSYEFYHCTVANRWQYNPIRQTPSIFLNNYYYYNDTVNGFVRKEVEIRELEKAYFGNCIIWGSLSSELLVDRYSPETVLNYKFENCLTRFHPDSLDLGDTTHFVNLVNYPEQGPRFVSWDDYNFELDTLSPAKDAGLLSIGEAYPFDKKGESRIADNMPDIGAFERIEGCECSLTPFFMKTL